MSSSSPFLLLGHTLPLEQRQFESSFPRLVDHKTACEEGYLSWPKKEAMFTFIITSRFALYNFTSFFKRFDKSL
jgi:hypothetical protein